MWTIHDILQLATFRGKSPAQLVRRIVQFVFPDGKTDIASPAFVRLPREKQKGLVPKHSRRLGLAKTQHSARTGCPRWHSGRWDRKGGQD